MFFFQNPNKTAAARWVVCALCFSASSSSTRIKSERGERASETDMVQPAMIRMAARRAAVVCGSRTMAPVSGERRARCLWCLRRARGSRSWHSSSPPTKENGRALDRSRDVISSTLPLVDATISFFGGHAGRCPVFHLTCRQGPRPARTDGTRHREDRQLQRNGPIIFHLERCWKGLVPCDKT